MPSVSMIPKRPTYHRTQASFSTYNINRTSREIENARSEWDALPRPLKRGGKRRLTVHQSQIKGVSCCDSSVRCERLSPKNKSKHHLRCEWFGDDLKTAHGIGYVRLDDCFKEIVPPKEKENE